MKKMKSAYLIALAVIVLIGALVWHFVTHYAYKPIWVDLGPIPEARNNPYFAAEHFLEKKGFKVKTSGLLSETMDRLENTDTLFLFYDHEIEYQTLSERVGDWVKQGGHLVITVHYLWDEDNQSSGDVYLDELGVRQYLWPRETKDAAEDEVDNDEENSADLASQNTPPVQEKIVPLKNLNIPKPGEEEPPQCELDYAESVTLLPLLQGSHPLRIAFEPEYHIEDISGNAHAPFTEPPAHMLQYTMGAGKITVLTDYFIFNDNNIGDYDHAFFLWWLAQDSPRVWLVYDKESDTLLSLIWESAPYLCLSVLLVLAGWLLYRGRRFGPILNAEHTSRRQLQEHIDASTTFIWRKHEQEKLIDDARQHVFNKCPTLMNQITRTPRLMRAIEQSGISEERLHWALTTPSVEDEAEFVELIRLLQQLRMNL